MKNHQMTGRILNWAFCVKCGLVALKNAASGAAMRQPCRGLE